MARHTTIIFLTALLLLVYSLSNAVTALPADSQPKRYEKHVNTCTCSIEPGDLEKCCSNASGTVKGEVCNFNNGNTMSAFQSCCAGHRGSSSCDANNVSMVQS